MLKGKSIVELAAEIERQAAAKADYVAPVGAIEMSPSMRVEVRGAGTFAVNDHAHGQIAEYADVPRQFYGRLRTEQPALLAHTVNTLVHAKGDDRRMIRTLDGTARAVVSDSYRPIDNFDLLKNVLPILHRPDLEFVSTEVTERRMYLKVISRSLVGEVKRGDVVRTGIVLSNSEVRAGAIMVAPFSERLVCLNGATHTDLGFRKSHVGRAFEAIDGTEAVKFFSDEARKADDHAFFLKFRDTVAGFLSEATRDRIIDQMRESIEDRIEGDPVKVVDAVAVKLTLNDGEKTGVLRALIDGADLSRFGLANAITNIAGNKEIVGGNYDRASELEQLGGDMMTGGGLSDYLTAGTTRTTARRARRQSGELVASN